MPTLTLAIPSKGRLKDDCHAYFADAGAVLKQAAGGRGYRAMLGGFPDIEVLLLSAGEIAASLIAGDVHLGITGEDLLREAAPELTSRIHLVRPLGFGFANVVVAVPQYWIDVSTMADLDDVCAAFAHRHRRRLPHGHRQGRAASSVASHRGRRALHLVSAILRTAHRAQALDRRHA